MSVLRMLGISMRSTILSILFILSKTEYSTGALAGRLFWISPFAVR